MAINLVKKTKPYIHSNTIQRILERTQMAAKKKNKSKKFN